MCATVIEWPRGHSFMQQKTGRPVQFEITPATRETVEAWIKRAGLKPDGYMFPSRVHASPT